MEGREGKLRLQHTLKFDVVLLVPECVHNIELCWQGMRHFFLPFPFDQIQAKCTLMNLAARQ